jgi:hypothetical protein
VSNNPLARLKNLFLSARNPRSPIAAEGILAENPNLTVQAGEVMRF